MLTRNTEQSNALIQLLNARLADTIDLLYQAKQAHWNVTGPDFYALHGFFETISDELRDHVDEIAERVTQLGGQAEGTLRMAAERSTLPEYPSHLSTGVAHLEALSKGLEAAAANMRESVDQAADIGDEVSLDILVGASRVIEKLFWMVRAHGEAIEPTWAEHVAPDRKPKAAARTRH